MLLLVTACKIKRDRQGAFPFYNVLGAILLPKKADFSRVESVKLLQMFTVKLPQIGKNFFSIPFIFTGRLYCQM